MKWVGLLRIIDFDKLVIDLHFTYDKHYREVFFKMLKCEIGTDIIGLTIIQELLNLLLQKVVPRPDIIIYVKTDPKIAFQRVQKRDRPEEHSLTLTQLLEIDELHKKWLDDKEFYNYDEKHRIPIIVVDGDKTDDEAIAEYEKCLAQLQKISFLQDSYDSPCC